MNQIVPSAAVVRGFADADRPRVDISLKWLSLSCGNVKCFGLKHVLYNVGPTFMNHMSGNLLNNVESIWGETNFFDALQSKAVFRFCSERGINRTVKPWKYSEWRPRPWSVAGTFPLNRTTGQRVWHRKGGENYRQWHREERPSLWPKCGVSFLETLL